MRRPAALALMTRAMTYTGAMERLLQRLRFFSLSPLKTEERAGCGPDEFAPSIDAHTQALTLTLSPRFAQGEGTAA